MIFMSTVKGMVVDVGISKTGKEFAKLYDGKSLITIFQGDTKAFSEIQVGETVEFKVNISTKDFFAKLE